jgi:hypothetical protein
MNCKNCNNKLAGDAKFCNKCGKPVEAEKLKVNIEKLKKSLRNTGNSVYAIGWITIIINLGLYLWSVLDKNFAESGLPASDLSGTFLMIVAASIFIILGKRIQGLVDKNIKLYLQILLGLSLLLLVWVFSTGGRVGIIFFLVVAYLISSSVQIRKAMKSEEFTATLTNPKYKLDKKGWVIFGVVAVVVFFVFVGIDVSRQGGVDSSLQELSNTSQSKEDLVRQIVASAKSQTTFPVELDSVTTMTDIVAEPSAIRYQYVLHDVDTSNFSNSAFRNLIISDLCKNESLKSIMKEDIDIQYSYAVKDSQQTYFTSFTKTDCSAY